MRSESLLALVLLAGCAGKVSPPAVTPAVAPPSTPEVAAPLAVAAPEAQEAAPEPEVVTTLSLCEPIGERWEYPDREQKKEIRRTIRKTCDAMGVGEEDCKYFLDIISIRESHYRPWVRHKLAKDVAAGLRSYIRRSHRYGWMATWDRKARRAEDVSQIVLSPRGDKQNPYFKDASRWMFGLGLGGLNISYHLEKFDNMAPPEILCDPVINTMIQITIARIAVVKYQAQNFAEIQAVYAGRTYFNRNGHLRPLSCTRGCPKIASDKQQARAIKWDGVILRRCASKDLSCYKTPVLGDKLLLHEMSSEDRYKAAERIRGKALPPFDTPPPPAVEFEKEEPES